MKLIYLPVERYKNRWSEYVSGIGGMFIDAAKAKGCDVLSIQRDNGLNEIKMGAVLDVTIRAKWSFWQITKLLEMIQQRQITDESVIYIEDFWMGGLEMLPYACHIAGIRPKVYAFCHAQSVDPNDFTYPMRDWMRPIETGWASWLTGIFVAADELRHLLWTNYVTYPEKIHVCGTVMRRQVLVDIGWLRYVGDRRRPTVVFASRPDHEKNPYFFVQVANHLKHSGISFKYLSGRALPDGLVAACRAANIEVHENIGKREYFGHLLCASLSFNCASQDFIGYCQLDALAAGCPVLCPDYLTFPTLLQNDRKYLYEKDNLVDACSHIQEIVETTANTPAGNAGIPDLYSRFGVHYEGSVNRMLNVMFAKENDEVNDEEVGLQNSQNFRSSTS